MVEFREIKNKYENYKNSVGGDLIIFCNAK